MCFMYFVSSQILTELQVHTNQQMLEGTAEGKAVQEESANRRIIMQVGRRYSPIFNRNSE